MKRFIILIGLPAVFLLVSFSKIYAVSLDDCNQENIPSDKVRDCIDLLSQKVNELNVQKNTLASQIAQFDSQIHITELKIADAQTTLTKLENEINVLGFRIGYVNDSIGKLETLVKERIVATYQESFVSNLEMVLSSNDFSDIILRLQYLKQVQENDRRILANLQDTKSNYASQKDDREQKQAQIAESKKQLEALKSDLDQQKVAKNQLLQQTQGSEANYQRLLAQAQAELAALSNFADTRAGGSQIIGHSDQSDSWGKYYNQRDSNWGNNNIGLSSEKVWEVGCLLTDYAMISTHFGTTLSPGDVAANTSNFWANTAYFNAPGPAPSGHSVQYVTNPSLSDLRNDLNSGSVVMAGLSSNGGPYPQHYSDHWVVLRSVDGDGFKINDPWYEGAMNNSLSDHYSGWTIIEARVYH